MSRAAHHLAGRRPGSRRARRWRRGGDRRRAGARRRRVPLAGAPRRSRRGWRCSAAPSTTWSATPRRARGRDHLADGPADRPEPGRDPRPRGAGPLHAGGGTPRPGRAPARAQGGVHSVHPARASGAGVRHRPLELSLPHGGQQHRPGARRRQRGAAQALGPDAVMRRAVPGRRSTRRACRRACSSTCT